MSAHVVIIGGGFGGLQTAHELRRRAPLDTQITLVSANDRFFFTPRLIDRLEGKSVSSTESYRLSELATRHRYRFIHATVTNIDRTQKRLFYTDEQTQGITPLAYDWLVLCPGSETNSYDIPGVESTFALKTEADVEAIHARVHELIGLAAHASDEERRRLLSFAIVGAGATGIEALFALREYVAVALEEKAPDLLQHGSFTLIQGAPQILPGFPEPIVQGTEETLLKENVTIVIGEPIVKVGPSFLLTNAQRRIDAGLIIWCAGIKPLMVPIFPEVSRSANGCLVVDQYLRVDATIYAAGDAILFKQEQLIIPKNAQTTMSMGTAIARNIANEIKGQPLKPYRYFSKGNILTLGPTGFIDLRVVSFKSRLVPWLRDWFYRKRFEQLTK